MIRCGTCDAESFVLEATSTSTWELRCANGHVWVPVPGTIIIIDVPGTADLP